MNNGGGNDYHVVGGDFGIGLGALTGASVYLHSDSGTTQFEINDTANVLGRDFTLLDDGSNQRLNVELASPILWNPNTISSVSLIGGAGADRVDVYSTINAVNRNAIALQLGSGDDTVVINEFTNATSAVVQGKLSMLGGPGNDYLFVNNTNDTQAGNDGRATDGIGSNDINQAYVDLFGQFTFHRWISYDQVERLALTAGNSPDTIFVNGIDPDITRMEVNGGGGNDSIEVEQNTVNSDTVVTQSAGLDDVLVETNALPGRLRIESAVSLNSLSITNGGRALVIPNADHCALRRCQRKATEHLTSSITTWLSTTPAHPALPSSRLSILHGPAGLGLAPASPLVPPPAPTQGIRR